MPELFKIKVMKNNTEKWVTYINRGGVEGYWYTNEHSAKEFTSDELEDKALTSFLAGTEYEIVPVKERSVNHKALTNVLRRVNSKKE